MTTDLAEELRGTLGQKPARQSDPFASFKIELARYVSEMKGLRRLDPDQAMAWLSSVSARVLEMMLFTLESDGRVSTKFRVEHLIPIRDECRFQFSIASRRHAVTAFDYELSGGQET